MSEQFTPNLIDNFDEINQQNIETFKKYKTKKPDEIRHKCVLCGRDISINDSVSCKGDRLVCVGCFYGIGVREGKQVISDWIWNITDEQQESDSQKMSA